MNVRGGDDHGPHRPRGRLCSAHATLSNACWRLRRRRRTLLPILDETSCEYSLQRSRSNLPRASRRRLRARALFNPPLRPAARASSDVQVCAVPCSWLALPPFDAMARCLSLVIDANPRSLMLISSLRFTTRFFVPLSSGRVASAARTHAEDSIATASRSILPPSRDALRFEPPFVARRTCSDPGISVAFVVSCNPLLVWPCGRRRTRYPERREDDGQRHRPADRSVNTATARSRRGRRRAPDRRQEGRRIVGQNARRRRTRAALPRHRRDPRVSRSTAGGTHVHAALVLFTNAPRPLAGIGGPPRVGKEALPCARRACRRQAGHTRSAEYRRDNPLRITSRRREPRGEAP